VIRAADHLPAPTIPNKWALQRLGDLVDLVNGHPFSSDDFAPDGDIPLVRIRDLNADEFEVFVPRGAVPRRAILEGGDVVIGMDGDFNVAIWDRGPAALNQRLCKLRPRAGTDHRFIAYALPAILKVVNDLTFSTTVKHLSSSDILGQRLLAPPLDEQRRIADFIDTEAARLDSLISARTQQLTLLEERRGSFLFDLLSNLAAPLLPLRRALTGLTDGPFGSAFTSADYSSEGAAVVRLGNIGFDEYRPSDQARIPLQLYRTLLQHRVLPGDILIAGLGDSVNHAGRACVAPDLGPAMVKGKCFVAHATPGVALPEYLSAVLSSTIGRDAMTTRGSTRQMINLEIVRSAVLPLPALEDQVRIVGLTQREEMRRKRAITALERSVALMIERRQSIITAAVTGQFDIATASGASA
jgi:type I restriction enzyme S subunit